VLVAAEKTCEGYQNEKTDMEEQSTALHAKKVGVGERSLFLGIEIFHPGGSFFLFSWQCNKHLKIVIKQKQIL
jgi:hypothetical protein